MNLYYLKVKYEILSLNPVLKKGGLQYKYKLLFIQVNILTYRCKSTRLINLFQAMISGV